MTILFYTAAAVAVVSTLLVITRLNPIHALLYLVVSLLAVAVIFYLLGAPFAAALEVIIYAGAIMVLFVFVVMMLNMGPRTTRQEKILLQPESWVGPALLSAVLLGEILYVLAGSAGGKTAATGIHAETVALALFGPYLLGVELASLLLLAGLVGAYHLGRPSNRNETKGEIK